MTQYRSHRACFQKFAIKTTIFLIFRSNKLYETCLIDPVTGILKDIFGVSPNYSFARQHILSVTGNEIIYSCCELSYTFRLDWTNISQNMGNSHNLLFFDLLHI